MQAAKMEIQNHSLIRVIFLILSQPEMVFCLMVGMLQQAKVSE